jgi:hypothetical protein
VTKELKELNRLLNKDDERKTQQLACVSLSCDHRVSVLAWEIGKQQDDGGPGRACEGGYINLED